MKRFTDGKLTVIYADDGSSPRLTGLLEKVFSERAAEAFAWEECDTDHFLQEERFGGDPFDRHILFAVSLGVSGVNPIYGGLLSVIRSEPQLLNGCTAGLIVDGASELYTKATATEFVFSANRSGCAFPGRPLVEATGSLRNFMTQAKVTGTSLEDAYENAVRDLIARLESVSSEEKTPGTKTKTKTQDLPRLLALHASNRETSNTLALWCEVRKHLDTKCGIEEIALRNSKVEDCNGCSYTTCLHYGERGECFYGGVVVEEVYPALERADGLILLCANYNDALSGNISAGINRLTALFRTRPFFDKKLFGIVVSGYSGGDIVSRQLISALNMNKAFCLPPRFVLTATANDPGSIWDDPGIRDRAKDFAKTIVRYLQG